MQVAEMMEGQGCLFIGAGGGGRVRERAGLRGFLARPVTSWFIDTLMDCAQQRFRSRALMAQICLVSTAEPAAQILPEQERHTPNANLAVSPP